MRAADTALTAPEPPEQSAVKAGRRQFLHALAAGALTARWWGAAPGRAQDAAGTPFPRPSGPARGVLWIQDNNMGNASGLPPDFHELFTTRTAEWAQARQYIGVYLLRSTALHRPANQLDDAFLRDHFLPSLQSWGIDLTLNVVGAMGVGCSRQKQAVMRAEADQIARIAGLGGRVVAVSLQSVLSKPAPNVCSGYGRDAAYTERIADIVRYTAIMKERFPQIAVGLVDAMVAKGWDYAPVYRNLKAALGAAGLTLDFLHLDFPAEAATPGWANARAAEDLIRGELGIRFGLLYTSNTAGRLSDAAFHDAVMAAYRDFRNAGGRPDNLVLTSWHAYPSHDLPENDPEGFPFMKDVLEFGRLGGVVEREG
jgi:hypothetical protein